MKKRRPRIILKLLGLFLSLLFAVPCHAFRIQEIPQLLKTPRAFLLSHPEFMKISLSETLTRRCWMYAENARLQCRNGAHQFIQNLQIQPLTLEAPDHQKSSYIVTFANDLIRLHQDPRTQMFLDDFNQSLDTLEETIKIYQFIAPQNIKALELGNLALKYFVSVPETFKVLAVLFQDLPPSEIQTHSWLQKFGDDALVRLLHKTLARLAALTLPNGSVPLTIFGQGFYNSKIYHQLVAAYLSSELMRNGYHYEIAFMMPFLFNYLYEAGEATSPWKTYFMEPSSLPDPKTQDDILAGQVGSLMGIHRLSHLICETKARSLLTQSPASFLRTAVRALQKESSSVRCQTQPSR